MLILSCAKFVQRERIAFAWLYWGSVSIVRATLWNGYSHLSTVDIAINWFWCVIERVFDCLPLFRTVVPAFPLRVCLTISFTSSDWCRLSSIPRLGPISLTMSLSFIAWHQFVTDTAHFVSTIWPMPLTVCLHLFKAMILSVFTLSECSHTALWLSLSSSMSPLSLFTSPE